MSAMTERKRKKTRTVLRKSTANDVSSLLHFRGVDRRRCRGFSAACSAGAASAPPRLAAADDVRRRFLLWRIRRQGFCVNDGSGGGAAQPRVGSILCRRARLCCRGRIGPRAPTRPSAPLGAAALARASRLSPRAATSSRSEAGRVRPAQEEERELTEKEKEIARLRAAEVFMRKENGDASCTVCGYKYKMVRRAHAHARPPPPQAAPAACPMPPRTHGAHRRHGGGGTACEGL